MKKIIIFAGILVAGMLVGSASSAQKQTNIGPVTSPHVNATYYVGVSPYLSVQSAVSVACNQGGAKQLVYINANASPSDTPVGATGCAAVGIVDGRTVPSTVYAWNGSTYYVVNMLKASSVGGWASYSAFGDSITAAYSPSTPANLYANRLGAASGIVTTIRANSGDQTCDIARQALPYESPFDQANPLYTVMIGTNDANIKGAGSYENVATTCRNAYLTWLSTSSTNKYTGLSFTSVPSNWSLDTYYAAVTGLQSTTNGSVSTWPLTTKGGPVAIWYRIIDGNGGTFSYSLDGGAAQSVNNFTSPAIATQNGTTQSFAVVIIPSVTVGSHNITITVTSTTGSGNIVSILAVGTTPDPRFTYAPPFIFSAGVPRQLNDLKSSDTAAYNSDTIASVNYLAGLGFGVAFVDVRNLFLSTTAAGDMADNLHANDLGHLELYQSFSQKINPTGGSKNLAAYMQYPSTIAGSLYNPSSIDSIIYTNGGTINLPSVPAGKVYFLVNYGSTPATISSPSGSAAGSIPSQAGVIVSESGPGNWFKVGPDITSYVGQISSGNVSGSNTDQMYFVNGGTYTLPSPSSAATGKTIYIYNYGSSAYSITGANGVNSIPPNGSVAYVNSGGSWFTAGYWAGVIPPVPPTSNPITSTATGTNIGSISSVGTPTNLRGTYTVSGGTFTTGTFLTLTFPATPTTYSCMVSQNGGTTFLGLGHPTATTTTLSFTNTVSIASQTFALDYACEP